eukprot:GCRY01002482.1.p2 GENE.GCRY01002482.1~~GCRY01002482.1.p2  ORF type:complete len:284 (-),score=23.59 GCRY01002482.1:1218-2069(-)
MGRKRKREQLLAQAQAVSDKTLKEGGLSDQTLKEYRRYSNRFLKYLKLVGRPLNTVDQSSPDDVITFISLLCEVEEGEINELMGDDDSDGGENPPLEEEEQSLKKLRTTRQPLKYSTAISVRFALNWWYKSKDLFTWNEEAKEGNPAQSHRVKTYVNNLKKKKVAAGEREKRVRPMLKTRWNKVTQYLSSSQSSHYPEIVKQWFLEWIYSFSHFLFYACLGKKLLINICICRAFALLPTTYSQESMKSYRFQSKMFSWILKPPFKVKKASDSFWRAGKVTTVH